MFVLSMNSVLPRRS